MGRTRETRRPWRVVTVVGAACTAACQLISGVDSLDVRDTTPALDASSDASTEGGGPDATQEGAADAGPESSPGKDAGADASLDASMDGSGGSTDATTDASSEGGHCQSLSPAPYFCADFDEDPDASAYWSSTSLSSKSTTLALTSMYAASAPRSSLSWAPTAPSFAYGEADFNSLVNPGTFTFAFDALIVTGDTSPNADLYVGEVDFVPWNIDIEVQYISPGKYSVDLWEVWYVADAGYGVATHAASGTIRHGGLDALRPGPADPRGRHERNGIALDEQQASGDVRHEQHAQRRGAVRAGGRRVQRRSRQHRVGGRRGQRHVRRAVRRGAGAHLTTSR